jgi:hypothetical protein
MAQAARVTVPTSLRKQVHMSRSLTQLLHKDRSRAGAQVFSLQIQIQAAIKRPWLLSFKIISIAWWLTWGSGINFTEFESVLFHFLAAWTNHVTPLSLHFLLVKED